MMLIDKIRQCAGKMNCRFRLMFRLSIVLLLVGIALVLFLFVGDAR